MFALDEVHQFQLPEIDQAHALIKERKFIKADALLQRASEICKYACGETSLEFGKLASSRAYCLFHLEKFAEARNQLKTFVQIAMKSNVEEIHLDVLVNIFIVYSYSFEYADGIALLDSILDRSKSSSTTIICNALKAAFLLLKQHKTEVSEQDSIEALLKTASELSTSLDSSDTSLLFLKYIEAIVRQQNHRLDEAAVMYKEILELTNNSKDLPSNLELIRADTLLNLADIYYAHQDYKMAEEYIRKSVEITDKHFDRDHRRVRRVVETAALIESKLVKWLQAEGLLRRLLDYYQTLNNDEFTDLQVQCMEAYCTMMEARGRGNEVERIRERISSIQTLLKRPPLDINSLTYNKI